MGKEGIRRNIVKNYENGVRVGVIKTDGRVVTVSLDEDQNSVLERRKK